jgi:hypothetical protein
MAASNEAFCGRAKKERFSNKTQLIFSAVQTIDRAKSYMAIGIQNIGWNQ